MSGRLKVKGRRGTTKLKAVSVKLAAGHRKRVKLKLSKALRAKIRKALRRRKRVTVAVKSRCGRGWRPGRPAGRS